MYASFDSYLTENNRPQQKLVSKQRPIGPRGPKPPPAEARLSVSPAVFAPLLSKAEIGNGDDLQKGTEA